MGLPIIAYYAIGYTMHRLNQLKILRGMIEDELVY